MYVFNMYVCINAFKYHMCMYAVCMCLCIVALAGLVVWA